MDYKEVSLLTINNGAAVELFQEEFGKVMRNINDISVDSEATREILLKVRIKPSKDRSTALTTILASSKLVSVMEHQSSIFMSRSNAYVTNPQQQDFDFEKKKEDK